MKVNGEASLSNNRAPLFSYQMANLFNKLTHFFTTFKHRLHKDDNIGYCKHWAFVARMEYVYVSFFLFCFFPQQPLSYHHQGRAVGSDSCFLSLHLSLFANLVVELANRGLHR